MGQTSTLDAFYSRHDNNIHDVIISVVPHVVGSNWQSMFGQNFHPVMPMVLSCHECTIDNSINCMMQQWTLSTIAIFYFSFRQKNNHRFQTEHFDHLCSRMHWDPIGILVEDAGA